MTDPSRPSEIPVHTLIVDDVPIRRGRMIDTENIGNGCTAIVFATDGSEFRFITYHDLYGRMFYAVVEVGDCDALIFESCPKTNDWATFRSTFDAPTLQGSRVRSVRRT
jgi:hypothetical protein